jgi:hypothetical protein
VLEIKNQTGLGIERTVQSIVVQHQTLSAVLHKKPIQDDTQDVFNRQKTQDFFHHDVSKV